MKSKLLKGLLTFGLAVSMIAGSLYIPAGSQTSQAAEAAVRAESRTWDLTAANTELTTIQGTTEVYDGIEINAEAEGAKFAPRPTNNDTQVNAGTILTIPVAANADGATLTFKLSGGSATLAVGETEYATVNSTVMIPLDKSETASECVVTFVSQAYLASIELSYNEPEAEYPGTPEGVQAADYGRYPENFIQNTF